MIDKRLQALRELMRQRDIDAYYIPTDDFHGSEYVNAYFKCREYMSGFTGSAGYLLVTLDEACLWTDGRYFIQAAAQLEGSQVQLMKMGEPGIPTIEEYIKTQMASGKVCSLGFDGRCVNSDFVNGICKHTAKNQDHDCDDDSQTNEFDTKLTIIDGYDLVGEIWAERPKLCFTPIWELTLSQCGESRSSKLARIREAMAKAGASAHILTSLEDIAWTLNLRADDIHDDPVFLAYLYLTQDRCVLFTDASEDEIATVLAQDQIKMQSYFAFYDFLKEIQDETILLDQRIVNVTTLHLIQDGNEIINKANPSTLMKAIKNETELANMRQAHIKDGVAVTKFIYLLKHSDALHQQYAKQDGWQLTEMTAAEILLHLRKEQDGFLEESFDPIMAYGAHGAIVHYSATKDTDAVLGEDNFLLSDTGAHYMDGTTDITRTISLAKPDALTGEQKKHYTLVLKSHLRLLAAKFPKGVTGNSLDAIAREPMWQEGLDFNHGTGHGVGFLLSVHEGPNAFRTCRGRGKPETTAIVPGMITSNEPGLYFENQYGIRLENLVECVKEENGFYGHRALTYVPFDLDAIDVTLMNEAEIATLNAYHEDVYQHISPYLTDEEARWLRDATSSISC